MDTTKLNEPLSFETARLLKELEFTSPTTAYSDIYYNKSGELKKVSYKSKITQSEYEAPCIFDVVDWLYKKHKLFVTVTIPYEKFAKFSAEVWTTSNNNGDKELFLDGWSIFDTIEEAYQDGILETLKVIKAFGW